MDLNEIYNTNKDFHDYIERYLRIEHKTKEEAFKEAIIQNIAKEYLPGGCNYKKVVK